MARQATVRFADYYKIDIDGRTVGGMIIFHKAAHAYELGRLFVDLDVQNLGIGAEAMAFLWQQYPLAQRWTLSTPAWNGRTRYFYQKVGFVEIGEDEHGEILFERRNPSAQADVVEGEYHHV